MLLQKISFCTLSIIFVLIFIGGYVGSSGVGLSCPEWPLCPAGLVPMKEFIIEYFHRTVAVTTGTMSGRHRLLKMIQIALLGMVENLGPPVYDGVTT